MNAISQARFTYINICRYRREYVEEYDFSNIPRPFFNIACVLAGECVISVKGEEDTHLKRGDILVIPDSTTYSARWSGSPEIEYITIHFILEDDPFANLNIPLQKLCGLDKLGDSFVRAYSQFDRDTLGRFRALSIVYDVLYSVFSRITENEVASKNSDIKKAITYLGTNYKRELSVGELADIAHLSRSRFFTLFKKETGMTPVEYKNSICVRNAEKLLVTTSMAIEEIADTLGFNSATYFRRVFNTYTGMSPSDYRKMIRAELSNAK